VTISPIDGSRRALSALCGIGLNAAADTETAARLAP